jgi:hypothetical protein
VREAKKAIADAAAFLAKRNPSIERHPVILLGEQSGPNDLAEGT